MKQANDSFNRKHMRNIRNKVQQELNVEFSGPGSPGGEGGGTAAGDLGLPG